MREGGDAANLLGVGAVQALLEVHIHVFGLGECVESCNNKRNEASIIL